MLRPSCARACGFVLLAVSIAALGGCSHPTATVTGKVTFGTKAVKGGNISFVSTEGHPTVSGGISEDGSYKLEGVPAGAVKVCIETESLNPAKRINSKFSKYSAPPGMSSPNATDGSMEDTKRFVKIPGQYASPETTPLTYTVPSGSGTFDAELK